MWAYQNYLLYFSILQAKLSVYFLFSRRIMRFMMQRKSLDIEDFDVGLLFVRLFLGFVR